MTPEEMKVEHLLGRIVDLERVLLDMRVAAASALQAKDQEIADLKAKFTPQKKDETP